MKLKLIFLLKCLLGSISIFSQSWTYVGNSVNGDKYYLRSSPGNEEESTKKVWSKQEAKSMTYIRGGKTLTLLNGYCLSLYEYDCSGRQTKLVSLAYYNSKGSVVHTRQFQDYETDWYDVLPDSIGEMLLNKACE